MSDEITVRDLDKLRERIDVIDDKVVDLLKERAELVLQVKKTKKRENINVYSPARERQILDRILARASDGNFPLNQLERIFTNIISVSRSLIGELQIAYLGSKDTFSQEAAVKQFGEAVNFVAEPNQEDLFLAVENGSCHFGVLPFSIKVAERLLRSSASVIAELELKEKSITAPYLVLGTVLPAVTGRDKTSLAFVLADRPGILSEILEPLTERKISLLNIQSQPLNAEQYLFYLELRGHASDPEIKLALDKLAGYCKSFRVLGSYPLVYGDLSSQIAGGA